MMSKRVIGLLVVFLFMFSLSVGIVSADPIINQIEKIVSGDSSGSFVKFLEGDGFVKFLIFVLVLLIVYAVSGNIPFLKGKKGITFGVSLIVAFLGVVYINGNEVKAILLSYGALGIVLTGILPFILIAVISKSLYEEGYLLATKILWLAFSLVLIFRYITIDLETVGALGKYGLPIILALSLVMLWWEKSIYFVAFKQSLSDLSEKAKKERLASMLANLKSKADQIDEVGAGTDAGKTLIEEHNRMVDTYKEAGGENYGPYGSL
jgi:glucan phosphoethanolaminetransferase (alkaline phosphatase superfamily)